MIRNAWWTCALLTVTYARIYDRCDLARELQSLGVWHEQISTWVCIAYHESRFDTAANNPHSGDHGIFQISELYWCGRGKACGLSCDALRDDSIADDLQCAQQVHEEHTRLQGDGFQAWVVYPQHCQGNTMSYLASCGLRNGFGRAMGEVHSVDKAYTKNPNMDNALPPYLVISSIFDTYRKGFDYNKINNVDWFNYKYDKIDKLKLPVLGQKVKEVDEVNLLKFVTKVNNGVPVSTTTTATSKTTFVSPVMPMRYINTNQFRMNHTTTAKPNTNQEYTFALQKYTVVPGYKAFATKSTTKQEKFAFENYTTSPTRPPATESTTHKSITTVTRDISLKFKSTTTSYESPISIKPLNTTNSAFKLPLSKTPLISPSSPTTSTKSSYKFTTASWWQRLTATTPMPKVSVTVPLLRTTKTSTTTVKPTTTPVPVKSTPWYTFTSRSTRLPQSSTSSPTTKSVQKTSRTTQSIWDLYLNPTKLPKYQPFDFSRGSKYKLNIFFDGTTTAFPFKKQPK